MNETPLRAEHERLGARMIDFAGWYLPVTYTSIKEEHRRVRTKAGLFDVSQMGRFLIEGPDHITFADRILTNDRASMKQGQIRYSLILNEQGGTLDDMLVYSAGDENTMLVVNAANRDKIWRWMNTHARNFNVKLDDLSNDCAMIALQGPESAALLSKVSDVNVNTLKNYRFTHSNVLAEPEVLISRTGYTGEDGFELIMPEHKAVHFWRELLDVGEGLGAGPAGLGARDTLRLEAGMPLYGHELDESINPLEAGLDWAVKLDKEDFIGKEATLAIRDGGLRRRLVGLKVIGRRIPRQGQEVLRDGQVVGMIVSGTKSPWLDEIIATAFVPPMLAVKGMEFEILFVRKGTPNSETKQMAVAAPLPFYRRSGKQAEP
jgi:aminomethyltransferase